MSDISVRTKTLGNENQTWVGNGGEPLAAPRSVVLDRSLFDFSSKFPNGYIPSGVALGKVTATGIYGPYDDAASDGRQTAVGLLFTTVPVDANSTGDLAGALADRLVVITANLPTNHGVDANAKTDLKFCQFL